MEHLGTVLDVTSSPTSKRPRIKEEEIDETWSSSTEESAVSDFTYESDVSQQDSETLDPPDPAAGHWSRFSKPDFTVSDEHSVGEEKSVFIRQKVLGIYRDLLRTICKIPLESDRRYLRDWAREEFKRNKSETDQVGSTCCSNGHILHLCISSLIMLVKFSFPVT
ncbi:LYR motif-containing protein 2 [Anabarilius grahami]|uniref:LYR motif-containing protein 2 n=1 Tax=Anabarilius grahami TaxID=495550 RepID=A0A3N0YX88_ANAGA|nr:LYR motif-containing protein 2 [Anabarilius grahami]